ncbi:hypothetical protein CC78DRAFT_452029 [Lojkania enalia]|uniref:RING-type domain-containing protein n=1 Tax=Lojkania enalia TaxID=147567 RepID=A0A9P4NBM7_9PLEO|nr:hypothetical protein CC78DRAFT_452029 [Didymosphaeria enalia]
MADGERSGLGVDLEKELSCSICTDLLYQPLTLLDCLHTFCGACLKEWFAFQASTATSIHPYTCPSCRASVRSTQPNATVTTLLDMFIKAHPERGKSEAEKKVDREKYKPGDNVLPKLRKREEPGADEDRRLMEQVQQMSLREVGISGSSSTLEPPRERRRGNRSRERSRDSRRSGREGRSRSRNPPEASSSSRREVVPPRSVEHQSSLRSLLSASEIDSQEIEEEIMRQIMEEGLLDGIDLNNIDVDQEDEISERIAQAYRRRQAERQRERRERRERLAGEGISTGSSGPGEPSPRSAISHDERRRAPREDDQERRRTHGRSGSGTSTLQGQTASRPPVSRPALIDAANQGTRTHHRRSSSQGSSRSSRRADRPPPLAFNNRQANVSTSDLGERPRTTEGSTSGRRRMSDNQQRSTVEERQQFRNSLQIYSSSNPNSPRRAVFNAPTSESPSTPVAVVSSPVSSPPDSTPASSIPPPTSRRTTDPTGVRQHRAVGNGTPPTLSSATFPRPTTDPSIGQPRSSDSSVAVSATPTLYTEPQISCKRCGKEHLEYELHYNCSRCDEGEYNLCLNCYRSGKGCKHWYGFGWTAWPRYERQAPLGGYPPNHEHPHILVGHRYRRPFTPMTESPDLPHRILTEDDPAYRLESGVFCDICNTYTNACYWKCDSCNEGAWGFCNDCVNQGRHCTHPLLPTNALLQSSATLAPPTIESVPSTPPLTPKTASLIRGPGLITIANIIFRPLTFTTICNICTYPIPPSHTRYHCPKCQKGDYDICMSCYHKLVSSGRICKEDGMNGWRRCLRGHRMVIVGFQDGEDGQRRIVTRDLVGGWALKDDESDTPRSDRSTPQTLPPPRETLSNWSWRDNDGSIHKYSRASLSPTQSPNMSSAALPPQTKFPPDGGAGLRVQALWGYFPGEGVEDELGFPKNAEIREAENINGDWFWGVYAGSKGLFPGNYGRVIGG